MKSFELILANQKLISYLRISILIIVANLAALILVSIYKSSMIAIVASVLLTILLVLVSLKKHQVSYVFMSFIVIVITWGILQYWIPALINLLLGLLFLNSSRILKIIVNENELVYPGFINKKLQWPSVRNIILKDDLLTIDLNSNHIIQELIDNRDNQISEKEFNEFCHIQMSAR